MGVLSFICGIVTDFAERLTGTVSDAENRRSYNDVKKTDRYVNDIDKQMKETMSETNRELRNRN